MTDDVTTAFNSHAPEYDAARRRLVPPFEAFYGTAIEALTLARRPLRRVLDLGAGTGMLSVRVAAAHPDAELVLLDAAPAMLERAAAAVGPRATLHVGDLRDALPDGPFDAVVSALAIHHLDDDVKRALFARAHDALAPGGVFVNAEHVAAATEQLDADDRAWHRGAAAALGTTQQEWSDAEERMRFDQRVPVEQQLAWLREAGFPEADCLFRHRYFAVLVARRA